MKDCNPGNNIICLRCWAVIKSRCGCGRIGRKCACPKKLQKPYSDAPFTKKDLS